MNIYRLTEGLVSNYGLSNKLNSIIKFHFPCLIQVRYRKVHIKKPVSHLQREIVKAVSKPKYPKWYENLPIEEICSKARIAKEIETEGKFIHPLDKIMGEEVQHKIMNSPFIAIFHANPCTNENFFNFKVDLQKINLCFIYHNPPIIKLALEGTHYEPLMRLYGARTLTFQSSEAPFAKILKIEKKYPFAFLIGGIYQGRVISITDIKNLALNSQVESYHSQLSGLLVASSQKLGSNLTRHQQKLCDSLQQYIVDKSVKK